MTAQRYAAGLEYDGTHFFGWQVQGRVRSVQEALNAALGVVADQPVATLAAGRTDAGVHATGQVVHFDTVARRSLRSWLLGVNSNLPPDAALTWIQPVPADFHARHSAVGRTYRYVIRNREVRSPLDRDHAWCLRGELSEPRMAAAGAALLGEHDFSAFRGAGCQARSPVRRVDHLAVTRNGEWLDVEVRANGFLYHMVRNIVGALVRIGRGEEEPAWIADVLAGRDRRLGAATAPPNGLYLAAVHYPAELNLPVPAARPAWRAR
ncbi:MAG: tRNA pseudouridine(38-40) synthase TruA [Gammaproteobacteria bacterium]|nr:tRNA pseudouridine(38-40) synthase TruA [Gammaproteobacteria bacterium]